MINMSTRPVLRIALAAAMLAGLANASCAQSGKPENPTITIGLSVNDSTFLPIYLAQSAGYFEQEGLKVKVLAFRGGSDLTRGVVASSVQIGIAAPTSVLAAINAGQKVKVFYGGFNQTPFFWYALPPIKSFADAKGKRFGISRFGSSTDALTRFVLRSADIDPDKDVKMVQSGGSGARIAAMSSKQLDVGVFTWPFNFVAQDRGYNLIASQSDFMKDFPIQSFYAMQEFIDKNPNTLKAVLRSFVRGVRLAKKDKAMSVKTLMTKVKLKEGYAGRAYDQLVAGWNEEGRLASDDGIKKFFEMAIAAGEVKEQWPREKYWDNQFASSFTQWAPK